MTPLERRAFFSFYKTHKTRRLYGFFRDLARSEANRRLLSTYMKRRRSVRCLLVGCSHWANPLDLTEFLTSFNSRADTDVAALDVLPDALVEGIARGVPLLSPAQDTPFCDGSFDVLVADGLLNCCCFDQHEPIIQEMYRIARPGAIVLLGLTHASTNKVVKWSKRPIAAYCRPRRSFQELFERHGFTFHRGSSIITPFAVGSEIATDNCIARKQ